VSHASDTAKDADAGERRHYLFVTRPRCPSCGSPKLRCYGSGRQGDASLTRYCRCCNCGTKLIVVVE
jgi:DNA-directed RNA polymerase subunit M/transcription elongation factor TFIIS